MGGPGGQKRPQCPPAPHMDSGQAPHPLDFLYKRKLQLPARGPHDSAHACGVVCTHACGVVYTHMCHCEPPHLLITWGLPEVACHPEAREEGG